eukprot:TRINITY_DN17780_c0_g1_i1.p1 TRINITY_DN17780_c0_g1~~TRINITY_DN17780_c0_g1_i1.p1  ORF type:complete len:142 (+),score=24.83 TRINITY_DN17780_c0_g1_i1:514-939(+)
MIVCVGVVGQANNPLFIQSYTEGDDALKFHHVVHCALDVVEEKATPKKGGTGYNETYLGLLYPTEDYKVYGYVSNTRVKFIMASDDLDAKEADVRGFFKRFHAAYVDAALNPFHVPGKRLASPTFAARVNGIVKGFGKSTA